VTYAETIALLRELQVLGFDDEAYRLLRETDPKDTIKAHLDYAAQHREMVPDGQSERIQRRLRLIRDAYIKAAFRSGSTEVFRGLAMAARAEIPG
jgi:hypothetical protein